MPLLLDPVETLCALGVKIASVLRTDHLIVAGPSNWGAWVATPPMGLLVDKDL